MLILPRLSSGHGSVLPMTEHFARHFAQMVEKMLIERVCVPSFRSPT